MRMRVNELWMPPRRPLRSVSGVFATRSWAWCMNTVPSGTR